MINILNPRAVLVAHMQKLRQDKPRARIRMTKGAGIRSMVYRPELWPYAVRLRPVAANASPGRT